MMQPQPSLQGLSLAEGLRQWLPLLTLGMVLLLLYLPIFMGLATSLWRSDQNAHGPLVLAITCWFWWYRWRQMPAWPRQPWPVTGYWLLALALLLYVIGSSQQVYLLAMGSLIPLLMGLVLLLFGSRQLRYMWFGFFFLLFVIPLPGSLIDTLTQPMKLLVSVGAEQLLYWLDYPVARSGVVLNVGPYQLLVADACAGLNSLFTLEALGLLYLNVVRHSSPLRNLLLAILIVPISFTANLIRVVSLALITYHWGDAAGQGFLHEFSGMLLFLSALLLIVFTDGVLRGSRRMVRRRGPA